MIDLDRALRDLAVHTDLPDVDVADAVRIRLVADGPAPARRRWRLAAATAAVVAATLGILPGTREAIADFFGIGGVDVRYVPPRSSVSTAPPRPVEELEAAVPASLAEAAQHLGRAPLLPVALGPPDAVHLDGPAVTLAYRLPSGPTVLIAQFRGGSEGPWVVKKLVPDVAGVDEVRIGDGYGLWIDGPHEVGFGESATRLASSVLLWERGDLTLRLEGLASKDEAIAFAGIITQPAV